MCALGRYAQLDVTARQQPKEQLRIMIVYEDLLTCRVAERVFDQITARMASDCEIYLTLRSFVVLTIPTLVEQAVSDASGAEVPVQLVSSPLPYSLWPGSTLYQTALTDLTGRKQMEDSLRRSEERLHLALRAARAGALDLDLATGTANWSDGFSDLLGLENRHSLASYETLLASLHPDDRAAAQRILRMVWRRRSNFRVEFRVLHPLKGARWLSLLGRVLRDEDGRPVRLTGIAIDVSERKQAEELLRKASRSLEECVRERTAELRAANVELERQIAQRKRLERQLLEVSEHMQRRIGQDLHDGLGQQLTGLRYLNNVLHEKLAQKSLPEADDSERLGQLLEQAKSQVRQLARGLHPVAIIPDGLMTRSDRELEIFQLIGQGVSTRKIADRLGRSIKTIETHRTRIKEKLAVKSAAELVHRATCWVESDRGALDAR